MALARVKTWVSGEVLLASDLNSEFNNLLNNALTLIAPLTASLNAGGFKLTNYGGTDAPSARSDVPILSQIQDQAFTWCGTAGGTANALTLTPSPAITAYTAGQAFDFKSGTSANTAAVTVAVSGLSTKAVQSNGVALNGAEIGPSQWYRVTYDGTAFQLSDNKRSAFISARDYGATGAGSADDRAALVSALAACAAAKKSLYLPAGTYIVSAAITVSSFTVGGRTVAVPIIGDGYTVSVISNTGTGAVFAYGDVDAILIVGIQIATSTGGGISLGECGGLHLENFYMNGCAAGKWAIEQTTGTVYTASITRSRFWNNGTDYAGGVLSIANALNVLLESSFISKQAKDGAVISLTNTKAFKAQNCQFETTSAVTTQVFISLSGQCFTFEAENCYIEGTWNTFVKQAANQTAVGKLKDIFAWQYAAASGGNASPVVLDISNSANHRVWDVDGLVYLNDHTSAGTGYIINDPYHKCDLKKFRNQSSGNQVARFVKQTYIGQSITATDGSFHPNEAVNVEEVRGFAVQNANQGSGAATSWTVYLPTDVALGGDASKIVEGSYDLVLTIRSADSNHATTARYWVIFDNNSNDYTTVQQIGTTVNKGTNPTALAVTVSNVGVLSVTANQGGGITQAHDLSFFWKRLHLL